MVVGCVGGAIQQADARDAPLTEISCAVAAETRHGVQSRQQVGADAAVELLGVLAAVIGADGDVGRCTLAARGAHDRSHADIGRVGYQLGQTCLDDTAQVGGGRVGLGPAVEEADRAVGRESEARIWGARAMAQVPRLRARAEKWVFPPGVRLDGFLAALRAAGIPP